MKRKYIFWFLIAILCIFLGCVCTNYDYDFFARIIVGERFIEQGILPFKDFLSYTPTHPWYDHEWGSGVVFYLILKYLGSVGLILFYSIMLFGVLFFVIQVQKLQKHSYPYSIIFSSVFLALFCHVNPLLVRCHLFTFLFFSIFLYILEKQRKCGTKLVWLIPFIIVLWNNLHGGVVSGLGLIFMYFVGEFLNKKSCKIYFYVLAVSVPLLVINPYGLKYLQFLLSATTMNRKYIVEWWPIFHYRHFYYYILAGLFVLVSALAYFVKVLKTKHIDYTKLIIVMVTMFEGFCHVKLLSIALIALGGLCYSDICQYFAKIKKYIKPIERSLYVVIFSLIFLIPELSPFFPRANYDNFPLYEVEFLKLNNIKGNIVVPFGMGSYVSYKLYPDNLIFMDGRYEEVYNNKEFYALRDYELVETNWDDVIKNYDTDILMPAKTMYVYDFLTEHPDWVLVFDGRLCGIFVKKENVKTSYIEPEYDITYYRRTMFKSTSFGKKLKRK